MYRGVLISGDWDWNREVPLYTEVSSFQGIGIGIEVLLYTEVSSFQGIGIGIEQFYGVIMCNNSV